MQIYKTLLAHRENENGFVKEQALLEHLFITASKCSETGSLIGLKKVCELLGLLHDFGKYAYLFQLYIRDEYKGNVNHSSAGSMVLEYVGKKVKGEYNVSSFLKSRGLNDKVWRLYREIMQYPILAHHGLYDIIDPDFNYHTGMRLDYDKDNKYDFNMEGLKFLELLNAEYEALTDKDICKLYYEGFIEFLALYDKLKNIARLTSEDSKIRVKALNFYYGALVRLLLSILKDADIYDSANCFSGHKDKLYSLEEVAGIWKSMSRNVEDLYKKFEDKSDKSELDIIRTELADEIYEFSKSHEKGAYKLNLPVGSGKTLASLRYSIANAKEFHKSRIFYYTAFLSVLEQNASEIKKALGEDNKEHILEHHSNVIVEKLGDSENESDKDREEYLITEYFKESWEPPIILSTIVQFSNTLFKDRASNIRRFSKLINSVIIIDEIQSLPSKAVYNFNLMTNFLTYIMNCNILHCTATQPNFDNKSALKYPCVYGDNLDNLESAIIKSANNFKVFDRVDYYNLLGDDLTKSLDKEELSANIKEQFKSEKSALVVLNTKNAVLQLYNTLAEDEDIIKSDCEVIYLTTNQCPKHRLNIIISMKERLKALRERKEGRKLICVSTKLVEAGVNIDFDIVYRSVTGLDSIVQCGGRCNREGKKSEKGKLFIFMYTGENLNNLPEFEEQRKASKTALRVKDGITYGSKVNIEAACDYYFQKFFANYESQGKSLEFIIKKTNVDKYEKAGTIIDLLTTNPNLSEDYKTKNGEKPDFILKQSFKTAAQKFNLINEEGVSVIVEYENEQMLERLYKAINEKKYDVVKRILRELQFYTIQVRRIDNLKPYVRMELDGKLFILNKNYYDKKIGLKAGELQLLMV
ncbi:MAG: CRISPR-associated helicase Cas3' [Clostridiaceae bacterium]|nr:CRISPR-associated helicase Cas3' [Clostridiaceae bacterium]